MSEEVKQERHMGDEYERQPIPASLKLTMRRRGWLDWRNNTDRYIFPTDVCTSYLYPSLTFVSR